MARIKRKEVPKHYLIVDTNELFQEVKNDKISEDFEKFWAEFGNKYSLQMLVPRVVLGELQYQHTQHALKILYRIERQFDALSTSVDRAYEPPVSSKKIKNDVDAKINKWIKSTGAEIIDTPIDKIEWSRLIDLAIWRLPPFDSDPNTEKGFRDSLIYETVCHMVRDNSSDTYAFITRDKMLRDVVERTLKSYSNCSVFESTEDFSTYFKLMDEKLASDFVKSIQRRAREKFHSPNGKQDLLKSEGIVKYVRDKYSDAFRMNEDHGFGFGLMGLKTINDQGSRGSWLPVNRESIWVQRPEFSEIKGERTYWWRSTIKFVQLFRYKRGRSDTVLTSAIDGELRIRILPFSVVWKADVKSDGRFYNVEFEEVQQLDKSFDTPTEDELYRYNLED